MNSIDLITDNLAKSTERVLVRVEEMREHCLVAPTPNGGGHTLWILGHLAFIEEVVVRGFAFGEPNPLAAWQSLFDGSEVSSTAADYPPFDEVLAQCLRSRQHTLDRLKTLSESDLDRPAAQAPENFEDTFGTLRLCFQFASDHWYMHRGQLADARRAAGIERMWL